MLSRLRATSWAEARFYKGKRERRDWGCRAQGGKVGGGVEEFEKGSRRLLGAVMFACWAIDEGDGFCFCGARPHVRCKMGWPVVGAVELYLTLLYSSLRTPLSKLRYKRYYIGLSGNASGNVWMRVASAPRRSRRICRSAQIRVEIAIAGTVSDEALQPRQRQDSDLQLAIHLVERFVVAAHHVRFPPTRR